MNCLYEGHLKEAGSTSEKLTIEAIGPIRFETQLNWLLHLKNAQIWTEALKISDPGAMWSRADIDLFKMEPNTSVVNALKNKRYKLE